MNAYLESVISGLIQGITEFLPISSSGHFVILNAIFGYKEPRLLQNVLLHCGTLLSVVVFFHKDIIALFKNRRTILLIIVGTIPIALLGFFFGDRIETLFTNTKLVAVALLVTGVWLFMANFSLRKSKYDIENTRLFFWQALVIGISQAIAVIPGISRSGATISTGLLLKRERKAAFRFSFLLSVPAILGALFYKTRDLVEINKAEFFVVMWGSITAFIVGIAALWILKKALFEEELHGFAIYCVILALVLLFV